jgi:hypothetical protein
MTKLHQITAEKTYIFVGKKDEKDNKIKKAANIGKTQKKKAKPICVTQQNQTKLHE